METTTQKPASIAQLLASNAANTADSLNHRDAAKYLDRTPEWLRLQNHAGLAPPSFKAGRERRYLISNLGAFLAQRRKARA